MKYRVAPPVNSKRSISVPSGVEKDEAQAQYWKQKAIEAGWEE